MDQERLSTLLGTLGCPTLPSPLCPAHSAQVPFGTDISFWISPLHFRGDLQRPLKILFQATEDRFVHVIQIFPDVLLISSPFIEQIKANSLKRSNIKVFFIFPGAHSKDYDLQKIQK